MIRELNAKNFGKVKKNIKESDIYNKVISKKMTVLDSETNSVWGFIIDETFKASFIQFNMEMIKGMIDYMFKSIDQKLKSDPTIETKIDNLIFLEKFYANFFENAKYHSAKKLLFNSIKYDIDNSDDITREYINNCIVDFLEVSRNNIPDEIFRIPDTNKLIPTKKDKQMRRAYFISDMVKSGILDYSLLFRSGEILNFNFEQIDNAFRKQNVFSREQLVQSLVLNQIFKSEDEVLDYYYKNDKNYFFEMANSNDLAIFLISGEFNSPDPKNSDRSTAVKKLKIDEMAEFGPDLLESVLNIDNLPKSSFITRTKEGSFINKSLMIKLRRDTLLRILYSNTIKYKNSLNSDDLVNLYGKLNFDDLEGLNKDGFVNSEDVIKIIKFYNVEENKIAIKYNLTGFYNLDKLEEMINENRINKKFMENFNDFSNEILNEEERKAYFKNLVEDLKQKENRDELIVSLTKKGFDFGKIEGYQISSEKVSDMYLNDEITENEMLKLYGMGVVPLQTIREFFGNDDEIIKSYEEGNLDISALSLIENNNYFKTELEAGRLTVKDIMELYSMDGGLEVGSLGEILDEMDLTQIGIGRYLPDTISPGKVEALFRGYYISQDELGELVGRGIITEKQADLYAKELATHKEYESIFNGTRVVVLTKETEGEKGIYTPSQLGGTGGTSRKNQVKIDPFFQERLLKNIGFDDRRLVLEGYNNSLNGYIVHPSEELGVMVFFNPNKPSNATYIMTIQQAMYFLKRSGIQSGKNKIESAATKQDLRETEHVKVKNACRGWGKNIIDTIKKLSPEMAQRLKDNQYKEKLDAIVSEIKTDYDRRR